MAAFNPPTPRRYTRTEFAGMLLGRLEDRGVPKILLNNFAKELFTGHCALNQRKEQNIMAMLELSPEELCEWRRLMRGGD